MKLKIGLFFGALFLQAGLAGATTVTLNFQGLNPANANALFVASPLQTQGFTVTSTLGFDTYGTHNTNFFAGAPALAAIAPSSISVAATDGHPFSVLSIDLARNFAFDPAPTVDFTGILPGGVRVVESFTVTTPTGTAAFQTFHFTGFTNLLSLDWSQPAAGALHQFTDITLSTGPPSTVPEPVSGLLCGIGVLSFGLMRRRTQKQQLR
ncbi:MAG: hypothetical protein JOY54_02910 [Acidobacteriaceae bacterium]|nr:hypothetical protein [Acidobacteriaceae bacterium]